MINDNDTEHANSLAKFDLCCTETSDSSSSADEIPAEETAAAGDHDPPTSDDSSQSYQLAIPRHKRIDSSSSGSSSSSSGSSTDRNLSRSSLYSEITFSDSSSSDSNFVSKSEKHDVANPKQRTHPSPQKISPNGQKGTQYKDNHIKSMDFAQPVKIEGYLKKQAPWFVCCFTFSSPTNTSTVRQLSPVHSHSPPHVC